jgi:hypothetical protein
MNTTHVETSSKNKREERRKKTRMLMEINKYLLFYFQIILVLDKINKIMKYNKIENNN